MGVAENRLATAQHPRRFGCWASRLVPRNFTSPIKTAAPRPCISPIKAAAPRPCNAAAPKDPPAFWFPTLLKGRQTPKFSRTRTRPLLYQDRRCEEALVQWIVRQRRSRAARSRRPLAPPVHAARSRRPLASPSRAARSRRPLAPSPRPARLRCPLAPPARARHAVLLILHGFGGAVAGCSLSLFTGKHRTPPHTERLKRCLRAGPPRGDKQERPPILAENTPSPPCLCC